MKTVSPYLINRLRTTSAEQQNVPTPRHRYSERTPILYPSGLPDYPPAFSLRTHRDRYVKASIRHDFW
jgi:hypothetical protein